MTTNSHSKIVKDIDSCQIIIPFDIFAAIIVVHIIQFISSLWGPIFMQFASKGEVFLGDEYSGHITSAGGSLCLTEHAESIGLGGHESLSRRYRKEQLKSGPLFRSIYLIVCCTFFILFVLLMAFSLLSFYEVPSLCSLFHEVKCLLAMNIPATLQVLGEVFACLNMLNLLALEAMNLCPDVSSLRPSDA